MMMMSILVMIMSIFILFVDDEYLDDDNIFTL